MQLHKSLHKLPFISQELVETLDWAWLIDFGQGNFLEAKEKTEIALEREKNTSNLLARAIVHQIQGEYHQALFLLENIFETETEAHHKFLIATVAYFVERKMNDNLADGFSLSPNKTKTDEDWHQKIELLKLEVHSLEYSLIINLIQQIASILPCWRTTILQQNNEATAEKYQTLIWQKLTEQLELYQQQECQAIADSFYCYFADLLALSSQFFAGWQIIENLASAYQKSEKSLETAWYLLSQGDLILETAPFGKSIVFGYQLTTNSWDFSNCKSWDRSQIDSIAAQQKYLEARQYFSQAFAPRGEAISIMRLAYINAVQKQWCLAAYGYEEAQKIFIKFGDYVNAIAAEMGYLWSFLQYETLENQSLVNIEKSVDWMFNNGTVNLGMSWCIAFTAAATEALSQEEGIIISKRLIKIAETIANKAIKAKIISISNYQSWTNCLSAISNYYRSLTIELALQNIWNQAFITAEKAKIYSIDLLLAIDNEVINLEEQTKQIISTEKIAQLLPLNTVLISFLVTSNKLLGWAITNQGLVKEYLLDKIEKEELTSRKLEQTINLWLNSLINNEADQQLNRILEQIFLQPFVTEIENCKHLLIAKCDRLTSLSFAGLKYNHKPEFNFLKKEAFLLEEKTISYLLSTANIDKYQPIKIAINRVSIYMQDGRLYQEKDSDRFNKLSLSQSLAVAIAQIYKNNCFKNQSYINKAPQEAIKSENDRLLIHLFVAENDSILENIDKIKGSKDLVIINIENSTQKRFLNKKISSIAKKILEQDIKTVVVIADNKDSLATAILTSFFHQGLYFGQTVAESMQQAQNQLRLITAQDALDFCQYLQSHIDWKKNSDRALRALITKHIGDIMVLGKNYQRAVEAYEVAINILNNTGYLKEAQSLENNYKMLKSLKQTSQPFQSQYLIFKAPAYWNNAYIYGNWQLSFTAL